MLARDSDDNPYMGHSRFIASTRQGWKLWLPPMAVVAAGLLVLSELLVQEAIRNAAIALVILGSTLIGVIAMAVPCVMIHCPRCRLKLLWRAVRGQESSLCLPWLLSLTHCPNCGYVPPPKR